MKLSILTRNAGVVALAAGALATTGAATASASPAPGNGVRHEIYNNTLWAHGQVARQMRTELWIDSDSNNYKTQVDGAEFDGSGTATDTYLFDPARNHVIHFHNGGNFTDEADPATYGADSLPSSGTTQVNGVTVEKRVAPFNSDATKLHGVFYVNPATGRIVRMEWDTVAGDTLSRTDITTDEVLPDTPDNHALAAVQTHPGASVEEFVDPPATGAAAKRSARAHAKRRKAAKHTAAKRAAKAHRRNRGR